MNAEEAGFSEDWRRRRRKKNIIPPINARPTTAPITPPAIAPAFEPDELLVVVGLVERAVRELVPRLNEL